MLFTCMSYTVRVMNPSVICFCELYSPGYGSQSCLLVSYIIWVMDPISFDFVSYILRVMDPVFFRCVSCILRVMYTNLPVRVIFSRLWTPVLFACVSYILRIMNLSIVCLCELYTPGYGPQCCLLVSYILQVMDPNLFV